MSPNAKSRGISRPIVVLVMAIPFLLQVHAESTDNDLHCQKLNRNTLREAYERLQPLRIYGRVVDQDGNPLTDAEVLVSWQEATVLIGSPDFGRKDSVMSGNDGRWEFVVTKPHRAFVSDVRKEGYYSYSETKSSSARNLVSQPTSSESPEEISLLKKGDMTFLVHREDYQLIRVFSPQSQTNNLDLLAKKGYRHKWQPYADLQVVASYDSASLSWAIRYTATNEADGFVASTNRLYQAPEGGYQRQIEWNAPPWPRYLYVKSRTPSIYSVIDLEHSVWTETETNQGFGISYEAWINPYGERNLEYDTDLNAVWRLKDQLEKEAMVAFSDNKRPPKPDLPVLIRQAQEAAEAEDQ